NAAEPGFAVLDTQGDQHVRSVVGEGGAGGELDAPMAEEERTGDAIDAPVRVHRDEPMQVVSAPLVRYLVDQQQPATAYLAGKLDRPRRAPPVLEASPLRALHDR